MNQTTESSESLVGVALDASNGSFARLDDTRNTNAANTDDSYAMDDQQTHMLRGNKDRISGGSLDTQQTPASQYFGYNDSNRSNSIYDDNSVISQSASRHQQSSHNSYHHIKPQEDNSFVASRQLSDFSPPLKSQSSSRKNKHQFGTPESLLPSPSLRTSATPSFRIWSTEKDKK
jgi:hypothetical protein